MNIKETLGFVLLAAGVVGVGAGFTLVSRAEPLGWLGVAIAPVLLLVAYKNLRAPATRA